MCIRDSATSPRAPDLQEGLEEVVTANAAIRRRGGSVRLTSGGSPRTGPCAATTAAARSGAQGGRAAASTGPGGPDLSGGRRLDRTIGQ
eukprot:34158-Alexandrium_andersonii.AAC.1